MILVTIRGLSMMASMILMKVRIGVGPKKRSLIMCVGCLAEIETLAMDSDEAPAVRTVSGVATVLSPLNNLCPVLRLLGTVLTIRL